ncbi:hypothetical protein Ddc_22544 [Ditylenchus destructor]|nr:hypothetical protein Ddc_22544 [Ditylenchus destructor]
MRRSTEKQAKFENEDRAQEPSAQKNRSDNRITNILALDNGTMVQVFKYLKYCGLAKTSLVSKRFCDLIRTHRHTLALLDVKSIKMHKYTDVNHSPTGIEIFDKVLSAGEYNEWVIRNGYSKQIPLETQIAGMQSTQYERKVYRLSAHADYKDSTPALERKSFSLKGLQIFFASIELNHENWPVFQHFFRILTDPFVYIRGMELSTQNDALNLLTGAINPDYGRLKCHTLSNFMNLKSSDEDKVVGFIECHPNRNVNMDAFKRNYADFVVEGNINQTCGSSNLVYEFINNYIGKKLRFAISFGYHSTEFTLKVANL